MWTSFKLVSFLQYLVFFPAVFCTELYCSCRMVFRMFLAFLIFDLNWPFCKGYSLCMGYSLFKMADFQTCLISPIFGFFFEPFFAQNNSTALVEWFFACLWNFQFLIQTDHFAKALAFAWAIAFVRWPIFKLVSFLQYLVFFRAVFLHRTTLLLL